MQTTSVGDVQWLGNREQLTQRSEINPTAALTGALRKTPFACSALFLTLSLSLSLSLSRSSVSVSRLFSFSVLSLSHSLLAVTTIASFRLLHQHGMLYYSILLYYNQLVPLIPHQHLPRAIRPPSCLYFLHSVAICLFKLSIFPSLSLS